MKTIITIATVCVASLLSLGTVMLYSSPVGSGLLSKQLLWLAVGLVACVAATAVDYRRLRPLSWWLYGVAVVLLAVVLIPGIGMKIGGARRWLSLHFMNFQPSEVAKLALIVLLAAYADRYQRFMPTFVKGVAIPVGVISPMLVLIILEPDYGTTALLAAVGATVLFVAGSRVRYVLPVVAAFVALISVMVVNNPTRLRRIQAFLHPELARDGAGFQSYQAMLALGNGGLTGLGLGDGRQKNGFVPENHTDFILSIIGEELGYIATAGVVLIFVVFSICGVLIARRSRDRFGGLLATGITFLIGFQAFINIGVVCSALPNKGLPLPFVSYGGSNLVAMLVAFGLLLNVARHGSESKRALSKADENPFKGGSPFQVDDLATS